MILLVLFFIQNSFVRMMYVSMHFIDDDISFRTSYIELVNLMLYVWHLKGSSQLILD